MDETIEFDIAPQDTMFEGSREHYFSVGESAFQCVRMAMSSAGKSDVRSILDFGCGFGRVLRTLKRAFPAASLTAADISNEAIEFCAKTFGATAVLSSENVAEIRFSAKFDLIWCGTVLTQFDAAQFSECLEVLYSILSVDGLLVFTTHGPFVARQLRSAAANYGLGKEAVSAILDDYDTTGFGYADHPGHVLTQLGVSKYGVSVAKPSWVCEQLESLPNARVVTYTERAWDNHQDSVACTNQ